MYGRGGNRVVEYRDGVKWLVNKGRDVRGLALLCLNVIVVVDIAGTPVAVFVHSYSKVL